VPICVGLQCVDPILLQYVFPPGAHVRCTCFSPAGLFSDLSSVPSSDTKQKLRNPDSIVECVSMLTEGFFSINSVFRNPVKCESSPVSFFHTSTLHIFAWFSGLANSLLRSGPPTTVLYFSASFLYQAPIRLCDQNNRRVTF